MKTIKIQNKDFFPNGEYRTIANESESNYDDDDIYFYVDDSINLDSLKIGDKIQLDEEFKILDIL